MILFSGGFRLALLRERLEPALSGVDVVFGDGPGVPAAVRFAVREPHRPLVLGAACLEPTTLSAAASAEIAARGDEPPSPDAVALLRALHLFSPRALADDAFATAALDRLRRFPPEVPGVDEPVEPELLAAVPVPCLVLAYAQDALTPPHQVRESAARIPGARVCELDLGHGGAIEDPAPVVAAVTGFLAEVGVACAGRS
ncbi:alpha/beta hydrolase [Actinosynnema sp. NPDC020468]|uniref:alpha/beta fold hydrolase n=1 Tax=Actinosynnema sp. NPDC020468 TaxID=3154488 RepID=UPI0033D2B42B